jgi:hypothetical protein
MGGEAGPNAAPKPPQNPADAEAERIIKDWAKSAEEKPREHLDAFLKHMKGWLTDNQSLYNERKARYETAKSAAKSQRDKNKQAPVPYPDPFVVNYESAQELADKLIKKLTGEASLESADNQTMNRPSEEVKKMVNMLWTRTVLPDMPMISNVLINGVRHIMFSNGESRLSVYPSGAITVFHNGETKRYLPPFPNVRLEFERFRKA